jgi:hypothetical protein
MKNITEDYQIATLRARFAARGYMPLNHHRRDALVGYGLLAVALLVPAIAAFIFY